MIERPRSATADSITAALSWLSALLVIGVFGWLTFDLVWHGIGELSWGIFWGEPQDAGRAGGIGSVLISTGLVLLVCLMVALPLGIGTAAWLSEFAPRGHCRRWVRRSLDWLASVPSIVFGLFGMVLFGQVLGFGYSIATGGLTLAVMIVPLIVQTTYAGFRAAPDELRRSAAALGLRRTTTLRHLLLPAAMHGVVVAVMLGIGRALAETAALIYTSGYVMRMPRSLWDSGRTLSVHIHDLAMNVPGGEARAHTTALVLLVVLLVINLIARWLAEFWLRGDG